MILLDNRYASNSKDDPLGSEQWHWLSNQLSSEEAKQADYTVIGTGIQVMPGAARLKEAFPAESKSRLLKLIKEASSLK